MKLWRGVNEYFDKPRPAPNITAAIMLETTQGRFTIREQPDGSLEINGPGPTDGRTHELGFAVRPSSSNDVTVGYMPRVRAIDLELGDNILEHDCPACGSKAGSVHEDGCTALRP